LLQSVLQQATSFAKDGDLLASLQDQHGMAGQMHQQLVSISSTNKKQGVSGESSDAGQTAEDIQIVRFDKDFRYAYNSLVQVLLQNLKVIQLVKKYLLVMNCWLKSLPCILSSPNSFQFTALQLFFSHPF
jgi:hypothetical protein